MASPTEEEVVKLRERADRAEAELAALQNDPSASTVKSVVSKSAVDAGASAGETELRKDLMMAYLLDSLAAGKDIGHYGRLVFAMVARHFLSGEEVLDRLTGDPDFSDSKARAMMGQVEERGYNPPKRDRILQWQKEQEFPLLPHPDDPDCGNLYRNLKFPDAVYHHIEEYQEQRHEASA